MPLQNRVTPMGEIVAVAARGLFMGNRGILHSEKRQIVRQWKTKAWIICLLRFKDRWRPVMSPGTYTELFFLDEATALAVGHRPCGECRYADYQCFKALWVLANHDVLHSKKPKVAEIDRILHEERTSTTGNRIYYESDPRDLPDGVFVLLPESKEAGLILGTSVWHWSPAGYTDIRPRPTSRVQVVTPRSIVKTIAAGYKPVIHPSATDHR